MVTSPEQEPGHHVPRHPRVPTAMRVPQRSDHEERGRDYEGSREAGAKHPGGRWGSRPQTRGPPVPMVRAPRVQAGGDQADQQGHFEEDKAAMVRTEKHGPQEEGAGRDPKPKTHGERACQHERVAPFLRARQNDFTREDEPHGDCQEERRRQSGDHGRTRLNRTTPAPKSLTAVNPGGRKPPDDSKSPTTRSAFTLLTTTTGTSAYCVRRYRLNDRRA